MRYVAEVEKNGIRVLYGPVDDIQKARVVADQFLDSRKEDEEMVVRVRRLIEPPWIHIPAPNPNQTTIQDHIGDIHDAIV